MAAILLLAALLFSPLSLVLGAQGESSSCTMGCSRIKSCCCKKKSRLPSPDDSSGELSLRAPLCRGGCNGKFLPVSFASHLTTIAARPFASPLTASSPLPVELSMARPSLPVSASLRQRPPPAGC